MTCEAWPIVWPCDIEGELPELVAKAKAAAQSELWARTGRRYGRCTVTEQYRPVPSASCWWGPPAVARGGTCCAIPLLHTPVRKVTSVTVFGAVLDPSGYYQRHGRLVRVGACWSQVDECDANPIEVTYEWGYDPPPLAELAMGEVAAEFLQGFKTGKCRLPRGLIAVTRQGVSAQGRPAPEVNTSGSVGPIGLPIADALIGTVNPFRRAAPSRVYSPDLPMPS